MIDRHEVGQVVYVISRKEGRVYPVLVVEETVRRTLEGSITSYMVRLPDKKGTVAPLDTVSERVFSSHSDLREFMIRSATQSINTMVDNAVGIGHMLAPAGGELTAAPPEISQEEDTVFVDMPDGTRARLKMPDVQG